MTGSQLAPARLALAEAKAAIELFGATYKTYSASSPDDAKESAEAIEGEYSAAKSASRNVLAYDPAVADDAQRIFAKIDIARAVAVDLKRASKSEDASGARRIIDVKFDPARDDVTFQMNRLINILGAKTRSTEAEAAEGSASIYRATVAVLTVGTAAALLGAFMLAQMFRRPAASAHGTDDDAYGGGRSRRFHPGQPPR